jgi:hypothetical protein
MESYYVGDLSTDNIKGIGIQIVDWIFLATGQFMWRALVTSVAKF